MTEERRRDFQEYNTQLAVMSNDISYIKKAVDKIEILVEEKYVTKTEFEPVKKIVYGMVAIILVAVIGAVITLVVKR